MDREPLTRLTFHAASVADDARFVALTDLGRALGRTTDRYRVIGGNMVSVLAARWGLGEALSRETIDADVGLVPAEIRTSGLIGDLKSFEYLQVAGNRFARALNDVSVAVLGHDDERPRAVVDVLVPAYSSRARHDRRITDEITTSEVPGLATALQRPPVELALVLVRLSGEELHATLRFADEVSALVLKALVTQERQKDTDIVDVWRCLEIALAAGVVPEDFTAGEGAEAADALWTLFEGRAGTARLALAAEQGLSGEALDTRLTRIRALLARAVGTR